MVEDSLRDAGGAFAALKRMQGGELSLMERARLQRLLVHPGMRANHVQQRANRLMPVVAARPLTCDWLRDDLREVMEAWLASAGDALIEQTLVAARFAAWLPEYLRGRGRLPHPALDALRYECALAELAELATRSPGEARVQSYFDYEPRTILAGWVEATEPLSQRRDVCLRVLDGAIAFEEA
jgi:hypothetical protein